MNKKVCIFCGANTGNSQKVINQTKLLCDLLIRSGYDLVYGGGNLGLMGVVSERFLEYGKEVIGIRPQGLIESEGGKDYSTQLIVVDSMQERKEKMIELADLFIALPGGIGTLDEIIETFTLFKIGFIQKQSAILNTDGYYDHLIGLLENMSAQGYLADKDRDKLKVADTPSKLMEQLSISEPNRNLETEIDKIGFIEINNGKVLVAKSKGKDTYYIPGGKRDEGETDEETLVREIEEELSVCVAPETASYLGTFVAQAHGKEQGVEVRITCYESEYAGKLSAASEIEEIDWFDSQDIDTVSQADKKIFKYLKEKGRLN